MQSGRTACPSGQHAIGNRALRLRRKSKRCRRRETHYNPASPLIHVEKQKLLADRSRENVRADPRITRSNRRLIARHIKDRRSVDPLVRPRLGGICSDLINPVQVPAHKIRWCRLNPRIPPKHSNHRIRSPACVFRRIKLRGDRPIRIERFYTRLFSWVPNRRLRINAHRSKGNQRSHPRNLAVVNNFVRCLVDNRHQ